MPRASLPAAAAAVALLALPLTALALPYSGYSHNPVEHDDQGRSYEPDFRVTGALGPPVENRIADLDLNGAATPDSQLPPAPRGHNALAAPGCFGPGGRQFSGSCGLSTIGVPPLLPPNYIGNPGPYEPYPPGRFSLTRGTKVALLDVQVTAGVPLGALGSLGVDANAKLDDTGLRAVLRAFDASWGQPFVAGPTLVWAWHGVWQDKNANGVIDHLGEAQADPRNEFVWWGDCRAPGGGAPVGADLCEDRGPRALRLWAVPGGHHAHAVPDAPGRTLACLAAPALIPSCDGGPLSEAQGDTLLEAQASAAPDGAFADWTGEPALAARGWRYTDHFPVLAYDHSLLTTTTTVVAVDPPAAPGAPARYWVPGASFADVDAYGAWNPALEQLLREQVKPTARSTWVGLCPQANPGPAPC